MQLYYKQHASSLAVHIALEWVGAKYEAIRTEFFDDVLYKHNPTGTVGFLKMPDGGIRTQVSAVMKELARKHPEANIDGGTDSETQFQCDRWLFFLTSDVHHAFHLLFLPDRYAIDGNDTARAAALELSYRNFDILDKHLEGRDYMLGDRVSVVDALLFPMIRWSYMQFPEEKRNFANLNALHDRMLEDPGVRSAMEDEEIWDTISR